jgi:hypothetical protein
VDVIVQLEREAADDLIRNTSVDPATAQLRETLAALGVTLHPQHPDTRDPQLSRYFAVDVHDRFEGERVAVALGTLRAVTAAYVKPQAEPP